MRPAAGGDEAFLRALFVERKREELAAAGLPEAVLAPLLAQQAGIHARALAHLPTWVLEHEGRPAGVLVLETRGPARHVVELVITAGFRRQGVARRALESLQRDGSDLTLEVQPGTAAEALYRKLGFVNDGDDTPLARPMRWSAVR